MSTRGFVGIGTPTDWDARYNHYDSYPTGLGAEVWATAQNFLHNDCHLRGFAHRLSKKFPIATCGDMLRVTTRCHIVARLSG